MTLYKLHTRTCTTCHYRALVTHSRHYAYSCKQELETVKCGHCNQLSVVPVTKEASYPHPTREEFRLIFDADKEKYFRDLNFATKCTTHRWFVSRWRKYTVVGVIPLV